MTGIIEYKKPTRQQLEDMPKKQAVEIDKHNKEAFAHNRRLMEAAKSIVLDVEPTLRMVRDMTCPPPDAEYVQVWQEVRQIKESAESDKDGKAQ